MDNRIDVCRFKDKRKRKADFPDLKGAFEMKCSQLLEHIEYTCLQGSTDVKVSAVVNDSRKIEEGCLFLCIKLKPEDVGKRIKHWACLISQKVLNEK